MLQVFHNLKKVSQNYESKKTKNKWYTFNFLANSPCQPLRKYLDNCKENIHTDVRV